MDRKEYDEKMKEMLSDEEIYREMPAGHGKTRSQTFNKEVRKVRHSEYGNIPTGEAIASTIKMLQSHSSKVDLFGLTIPDVKKTSWTLFEQ